MWKRVGPAGPPGASGAGSINAQNQGVPLPGTFSTINFTGAGVTAMAAGTTLTVEILGGSSQSNLGLVYAMGTTNTFMP